MISIYKAHLKTNAPPLMLLCQLTLLPAALFIIGLEAFPKNTTEDRPWLEWLPKQYRKRKEDEKASGWINGQNDEENDEFPESGHRKGFRSGRNGKFYPVDKDAIQYCRLYTKQYQKFCLTAGMYSKAEERKLQEFCPSYERTCLRSVQKKGLESGGRHYPVDKDAVEYCKLFVNQYRTFCLSAGLHTKAEERKLMEFCPSYERTCRRSAPRKRRSVAQELPPLDDVGPAKIGGEERLVRQEFPTLEDLQAAEVTQQSVPCTPDCDQSIWPHCTAECKCDYAYPSVQQFCNPPPMALFLNTCRLWYYSCPKYRQYHYASQFIHSKANKGKVMPGVAEVNPVSPYGIQTLPPSNPGGFGQFGSSIS